MTISLRGVSNAAGQNAGTTTTASTVSITATLPTGTTFGDRVFVEQFGSNTAGPTPANWNVLGTKDTVIGSGAVAASGGLRYMTVYWRDRDSNWTMPAFTLTSAAQNSHWVGAVAVTPTVGSRFDTPTITTVDGAFNTAGTAYTDSSAASFATTSNGFLIIGTCLNDNVTSSSPALTQSGATFGTVTERCDGGTATGNDVAGQVHTCSVTTGASATTTFTQTLSAASQGETLIVQQTESALPLAETFTDDFATQDTSKWDGFIGGEAEVVSGQLQVTLAGLGGAYAGINSKYPRDYRDSGACVEVAQRPNVGDGSTEAGFYVRPTRANFDNRVWIVLIGTELRFYETIATSHSLAGTVTYDPVAHRWWRIRTASGTTYWDTSPDGTTWTNRRSKASGITMSSLYITLQATNGTEVTPGVALFDNVNSPPAGAFTGAGTSTVTATVTGSGVLGLAGSGSLTVTATVAGAGTTSSSGSRTVAATIAGSGLAAATGAGTTTTTATITGGGVVGAAGAGSRTATATITGAGTAAGAGTLTAAATITGAGVLATTGTGSLTVAATIAGSAGTLILGAGTRPVTATIAGSGTAAVTGTGARTATATITGAGVAAATGTGTSTTAATITGSGVVAVTGSGARAVTATITGSSGVGLSGSGTRTVTASITGAGALGAPAVGGTLTAVTVITGSGIVARKGNGAILVVASITGSAGGPPTPQLGRIATVRAENRTAAAWAENRTAEASVEARTATAGTETRLNTVAIESRYAAALT